MDYEIILLFIVTLGFVSFFTLKVYECEVRLISQKIKIDIIGTVTYFDINVNSLLTRAPLRMGWEQNLM